MRLAFLGTPEAAVPSLEALVLAGHDVAVVITRPDRRRGRGSALVPSAVKRASLALDLRVRHDLGELAAFGVERGVVVAFGAMIPAAVLARVPMLNVHFSLLPRWRGAAPVQRAILAGDEVTGVSIISLEESLDTGPIHLARRVRVDEKTAAELTSELASLGAASLLEVLSSRSLLESSTPQVGVATYAEKISKELLRLRPTMDVATVLRTIRLGGAYLMVDARRLAVVSAHVVGGGVAAGSVTRLEGEVVLGTRGGAFALESVRPEGSVTMSAAAWWIGRRDPQGALQWS